MSEKELEKFIKNDPGFKQNNNDEAEERTEEYDPLVHGDSPNEVIIAQTSLNNDDNADPREHEQGGQQLADDSAEEQQAGVQFQIIDTTNNEQNNESTTTNTNTTNAPGASASASGSTTTVYSKFDDTGELTNGNTGLSFEEGFLDALSYIGTNISKWFNDANKLILGLFNKPIPSCIGYSKAISSWLTDASNRIDKKFKKYGVNPKDVQALDKTLFGKIFKQDMTDLNIGQTEFMKVMMGNLSQVKTWGVPELSKKLSELEQLLVRGVELQSCKFVAYDSAGNLVNDSLGVEDLARLTAGDGSCGGKYAKIMKNNGTSDIDISESDKRQLSAYIDEYRSAIKYTSDYCKKRTDIWNAEVTRTQVMEEYERKANIKRVTAVYTDPGSEMSAAQKIAAELGFYDKRGFASQDFRENKNDICRKINAAVSEYFNQNYVRLMSGTPDADLEKDQLQKLSELCSDVEFINKEINSRKKKGLDRTKLFSLQAQLAMYLNNESVMATLGRYKLDTSNINSPDPATGMSDVFRSDYLTGYNTRQRRESLLQSAAYDKGSKTVDEWQETVAEHSEGARVTMDTGGKMVMFAGLLQDANSKDFNFIPQLLEAAKAKGDINLETPEETEYRANFLAINTIWSKDAVTANLRAHFAYLGTVEWDRLLNDPVVFANANFSDSTNPDTYLFNKRWMDNYKMSIPWASLGGRAITGNISIFQWYSKIAPILADKPAYIASPKTYSGPYTPADFYMADQIKLAVDYTMNSEISAIQSAISPIQEKITSLVAAQRGAAAMRTLRYFAEHANIDGSLDNKVYHAFLDFFESGVSVGLTGIASTDYHVKTDPRTGEQYALVRDPATKKEYPLPLKASKGSDKAYQKLVDIIEDMYLESRVEGGKRHTEREDLYKLLTALKGSVQNGNEISKQFRNNYGVDYSIPSDPTQDGFALSRADEGELWRVATRVRSDMSDHLSTANANGKSYDKFGYTDKCISAMKINLDGVCSQIDHAMNHSLMHNDETVQGDVPNAYRHDLMTNAISAVEQDLRTWRNDFLSPTGAITTSTKMIDEMLAIMFPPDKQYKDGKELGKAFMQCLDTLQTDPSYRFEANMDNADLGIHAENRKQYLDLYTKFTKKFIEYMEINHHKLVEKENEREVEREWIYQDSQHMIVYPTGWSREQTYRKFKADNIRRVNAAQVQMVRNRMYFENNNYSFLDGLI